TLDEGSPGAALDRFATQDGVSVGGVTALEVNGLPAVLAPFSARVEGGTLRGEVLFVSHRGTTYRFLGYTADARWSGYAGTIGGALRSFRPETDADVLAVQPDRLSLVELDRALSFDAFLDRYPSAVRPEVVALINQVEAGATLPSGLLAKRVVDGR
ncbi:MAG TPA: hypothetical protein VLL48_09740, partial [Longimicrobiales bacterium]|nr:hypothetical protein [Longimicrobiales bacterium]